MIRAVQKLCLCVSRDRGRYTLSKSVYLIDPEFRLTCV